MYEKLEGYLRVNLLGPGPRLIKKSISRAAVSQRLRNTVVDSPWLAGGMRTNHAPFSLKLPNLLKSKRNLLYIRNQCTLCSLHETMDRNHLGRCTALSSGTECERYWEARTKMMEY